MVKQHNSLDVAKFISAILIIIIHTAPFASYSKLLTFAFRNYITVIAVPFFFATSGFLLSEKLASLPAEQENTYMKKYLKRLLSIYAFWSVIYFPFVVIKWVRKGFCLTLVLEYIKDFIFEGSYSTIWFLPALMVATLVTFLLHKKIKYKKIFAIGCLFYVFTLLASSYYGLGMRLPVIKDLLKLYYSFFDSVKNGLLFGLIYVSLGGMVFEENMMQKLSQKKNFAGVAMSALLLLAEVIVYKLLGPNRGVDTVAALVPLTLFTLLLVLNIEVTNDKLCYQLRKYSMLLFLCQRIPISVFEMFFSETIFVTNSLMFFVVITMSTFAISFVILKLSQRFKFLKKVY